MKRTTLGYPKSKDVKKKPEKYWKSRCWSLISIKVRSRGYCEMCKKELEPKSLDAAHIIPRNLSKHLWCDESNLMSLCYYCHIQIWHKYPHKAIEWFDREYPDKYRVLLNEKEKKVKIDYEELYNSLKQ